MLTVLEILGISLGPLIAAAGIAGVALGFGAQSLVKDFLTGMFMLMEDQFGVGDVIDTGVAVAGGMVTGTVEGVSLRTTRLRDIDGVVWHIPNGNILRVGNKSQQWARAVVDVPVTFQTDAAAATEVIRTVSDQVWHDPEFASIDPGRAQRARGRVVGTRARRDPRRRAHPTAGAVAGRTRAARQDQGRARRSRHRLAVRVGHTA